MSEYIITDEQLQKDHEQFYEAGQRNRQVWTARVYHGQKIVRCRDCESAYENESGALRCHGYLVDSWDYYNDEPSNGKKVEPDGFCAWGARKEVNNDN